MKESRELKYKIYCDCGLIAAFTHESDRDNCIEHMREEYDDVKLTTSEE